MSKNINPIVRGPSDGEMIYVGGALYRFLAVKDETDGKYGLWEAIVPPGGGTPPHLHRNEEEGFYIVSGTVTVYGEGLEVETSAGSFVHLPANSTHWFRNNSAQNAKMIVVVAPGGMEAMFKETGRLATDPTAPIPPIDEEEIQKLLSIAPKYGIEISVPS